MPLLLRDYPIAQLKHMVAQLSRGSRNINLRDSGKGYALPHGVLGRTFSWRVEDPALP
jgi:hypothetical protein